VHTTTAVSRPVADAAQAATVMSRLRHAPPDRVADYDATVTDLLQDRDGRRTDALILSGGDGETTWRVVVRPSGTEPKIKSYIEVRCKDVGDLSEARGRARRLQDELAGAVASF
jgi:phosphomannomutase